MNLQLWLAIIVVGGMFLFFTATQLNLLLGVEKTHEAEVTGHKVYVGGRSNRHTLTFKTESGEVYEAEMNTFFYKRIAVPEGAKVKIVTDGLLWSTVMRVDSGKGFNTVR